MIHSKACSGVGLDTMAADWAVAALRWPFRDPAACRGGRSRMPDLAVAGGLFIGAHETMLRLQGSGLLLAAPGTVALTRHERRLLRATAAAQAENEEVVDNYLFKLAPHPRARLLLVDAVTALAAGLLTAGRWLQRASLPAPALRVARLHGIELGALSVVWGSGRNNA